MMIVRAIFAALRSVVFALVLLLGLVYIFGLIFTQAMNGAESEPGSLQYDSFRSLPHTMHTLLMLGALPDQAEMVTDIAGVSWALYPVMLLYVFLASLTIMNMLIGILCEVVSVVSQVEKEELLIKRVEMTLASFMEHADEDESRTICQQEFVGLLKEPLWVRALGQLGVDIFGLIDLADWIFEKSESLSFSEFMEVILQLRGSNSATVKDIVDLRRLLKENHHKLEAMIAVVVGGAPVLESELK